MENIKLNVSAEGAEKAAESMNRLAEAAERAEAAIASLEGRCHEGISIYIVGDLCRVDVSPSHNGE